MQASVWVHALPSLHGVPSAAAGELHVPVVGAQVPGLQASGAVQTTGLLPVQTPPMQASVWVHALPSSHTVPSGAAGFEHMPLVGSQVPAMWQASEGAHTGV